MTVSQIISGNVNEMSGKRVFLFNCVDFPDGMASTAHTRLMIKGLRENNVRAVLLIPYGDMGSRNNTRLKGHFDGVPFLYLNKTTARPRNLFLSSFQILRGMLAASLSLVRNRKKIDAVIIDTPDFIKYLPVFVVIYFLGIPLFVWSVEKMSAIKQGSALRGVFSKIGAELSEAVLPRIASGYIVISSYLREFYSKRIDQDRILVSPILVERSGNHAAKREAPEFELSHGRFRDKKMILYSGSFGEKDGVDYILKAFGIAHQVFPNTLLVMTGKPFHERSLEPIRRLMDELGVSEHVDMPGLLDRDNLNEYTRAASVLLVCRTKSEFSQYGFPWKLGEYCLTGKPIVATDVGDLRKYFTNGEHLFFAEPENPASIAQTMIEIFSDYSRALEIGENARRRASEIFDYRWQMSILAEFLANGLASRWRLT